MTGTAGPSLVWYIARGSGFAAFLLLTGSVALGIALSRRWYGRQTPRLVVEGAHRWLTLTFYLFTALHVATLMLDPFTHFSLRDMVIPFASTYRPFWLSLGIIATELGLAVGASVWLRRWIGYRAWHVLHGLAYVIWPITLLHGLGTGTDTRTFWGALLYVGSAVLVLGLLAWRTEGTRWRTLTVGASVVATGVLLVWSLGGPFAAGWATKAGTPPTLLTAAAAQRGIVGTPVAARQPAAPAFPVNLHDTISGQTLVGSNRRQVLLKGSGTGTAPLDVAIEINNSRFDLSGEVQLRTADHTPLCDGPVTSAEGSTVTATCSGYGHQLQLQITFDQLDANGFSADLIDVGAGGV